MSGRKTVNTDLIVGAAAVAVFGAGLAWFLLGGDSAPAPDVIPAAAVESNAPAAAAASGVSAAVGESAQVTLNKARMALNADMLAEPPGQNALYFYSLALESEPDNPEIQEELAAVADTVSGMIRGHLGNDDFAAAESLAARLELAVPDAEAVVEFKTAVAERQRQVLAEALSAARNGDDAAATRLLTAAAELPNSDAAEVALARRQIAELAERRAAAAERAAAERQARRAAEEAQRAEAQAAQAEAATQERAAQPPPSQVSAAAAEADAIRNRMEAGELIGGDSAAADLLAARQSFPDATEIAEVGDALIAAIAASTQRQIAFEQLVDAEDGIAALSDLGAADAVESLSAALNDAYIRREGARVIPANDLELVEAVPPVYPRAALRRDQEGWVEVEFTVNRDGRTEDIEVVATADTSIFNRATIQAVQQWQFEPRVFRGQPIDQRVMTRVIFQLTGS